VYTQNEFLRKNRISAFQAGMNDVTRILSAIEQGDPSSATKLLPLVYDELRKLAAAKMSNESADQTLQDTALVHEAYLRLVDVEKAQHFDSRGHFFAAAAEAMRRILVESARRKASLKRGGQRTRVDLGEQWSLDPEHPENLLALDEALERLAAEDPVKAKLVNLRFFAGLSHQEAAQTLRLSRSTADRYWVYVKAWLKYELTDK
jgi:RNA polymerase sigma factor (TIGR02999 family)